MKPAYLAATIRAAEEPVLEAQPGLLMQASMDMYQAHGLQAFCVPHLR